LSSDQIDQARQNQSIPSRPPIDSRFPLVLRPNWSGKTKSVDSLSTSDHNDQAREETGWTMNSTRTVNGDDGININNRKLTTTTTTTMSSSDLYTRRKKDARNIEQNKKRVLHCRNKIKHPSPSRSPALDKMLGDEAMLDHNLQNLH
jgi:hypothetical protein